MSELFQIIIGFSSGISVGAGFIAFITILGVIPQLIQISHAQKHVKIFVVSIIFGTLCGTYFSFTPFTFNDSFLLLIIFGVGHGIFNGMLVAALAEILNVFPILAKRLQLKRYLLSLFMAIIFGKVVGSLFQWLYFVHL